MRKKPFVATRKVNMYFNYFVGTKRLIYILTFLVATTGFFLITIFSAVLITWKVTLANILMINKKINIMFKLLCVRSTSTSTSINDVVDELAT